MNKLHVELDRLVQIQSSPTISELSEPDSLIGWAIDKFADQKIVLTTSFGMEGCALIDLFARYTSSLTVAYIDTGFFFPETLKLRDQLVERYSNFNFERWQSSVSVKQQSESHGPELWSNNPNMCCHIRKVLPMQENIQKFQLWITGLRRGQTDQRSTTPVLNWDWKYQLLKFCPFSNWTRPKVWDYIKENDVPFNPLHLQGYPSVSCTHCTRSVPGSSPESDSRDGRWQGQKKTECGLHYSI